MSCALPGYERAGTVHCNSIQGGHRFGARIETNFREQMQALIQGGGGSSSTSQAQREMKGSQMNLRK